MAKKRQDNSDNINYITEEGFELLKKEYDERSNKTRKEIAEKIDEARRFGDLSENNAYTSAMEEKDFNEARIEELEELIQTSKVVEPQVGVVSIGTKVHLKTDKGVVVYKIVGAEESDPTQSLISDKSPLGRSLLGKKEGDKVNVTIPSGKMEFTIVKVE